MHKERKKLHSSVNIFHAFSFRMHHITFIYIYITLYLGPSDISTGVSSSLAYKNPA